MLLLGVFLLLSNSLWVNAQKCNNTPLCVEVDTLSALLIRIELPCGYKKSIYNYEEGKFIDYSYKDGSIITLFKGALQKMPLLSNDQCYIIDKTDTLSNKTIIRGTRNDKFWREDSFEGVRVYYENVPIDKMDLFDKVLDNLFFLKVKNNQ